MAALAHSYPYLTPGIKINDIGEKTLMCGGSRSKFYPVIGPGNEGLPDCGGRRVQVKFALSV